MSDEKTVSEEIDDRAFACALGYLESRGHEVVFADRFREGFQAVSVSRKEGDRVVFTRVVARRPDLAAGEEPFPPFDAAAENREGLEASAAAFLAEHDHLVGNLRFDEVALCILPGNRAMARHRVDVMN